MAKDKTEPSGRIVGNYIVDVHLGTSRSVTAVTIWARSVGKCDKWHRQASVDGPAAEVIHQLLQRSGLMEEVLERCEEQLNGVLNRLVEGFPRP